MLEASRNTVVFTFQIFLKNKNKKGLLADFVYTWLNHRLIARSSVKIEPFHLFWAMQYYSSILFCYQIILYFGTWY